MDRVLPGESLPGTLSLSNKEIPQGSHGVIYRRDPRTVCDLWAENFVKRPAVLLTERIQNLRLDGLLTLIAIKHGKSGGLISLTRYLEQMRENVNNFDKKRSTNSWTKIRDLRRTLIQ